MYTSHMTFIVIQNSEILNNSYYRHKTDKLLINAGLK